MFKKGVPSHLLIWMLLLGTTTNAIAEDRVDKKTPLTSVGAVSSLDAPPDANDPGIGGGFDHISYFRNRLIPKLADCTAEIEAVYQGWAEGHNFLIPVREILPGDLLIHATKEGLNGFFELIYRVDAERERARVTVLFVSPDGRLHDPLSIKEMLMTWEIDTLQDDLDAALACGTA